MIVRTVIVALVLHSEIAKGLSGRSKVMLCAISLMRDGNTTELTLSVPNSLQ